MDLLVVSPRTRRRAKKPDRALLRRYIDCLGLVYAFDVRARLRCEESMFGEHMILFLGGCITPTWHREY